MTRRTLLLSLPMVAPAARLFAQGGAPSLPVRALNHMTLTVADRKRSVAFYQGLFGLPFQHMQGTSNGLRIGAGPQYVSLSQGGPKATPGINHICWTVEGFDVARVMDLLASRGVASSKTASASAMTAWVRMRGEDAGGAKEGTPELYVNDPEGLRFQLQDPRYCGGSGVLGEGCPNLPATKGLITVRDYQSFTLAVSNRQRSQEFYQSLFGMPASSRRGSATELGVGKGPQRLIIDAAPAGSPPRIAHACFVVDGFDAARMQQALADLGVKAVAVPSGAPGPLVSYVRQRSEADGGAPGGTAELFFTDPDGILIQLA